MKELVNLYRIKLGLSHAVFTRIFHKDALVAIVYKISQSKKPNLILKICPRKEDFFREVYFLSRFADKIPVPKILDLIEPEGELDGAILMECIEGHLLHADADTLNNSLVW